MTNSSNSMTLPKLNSILSADAALIKALTSIDGLLLGARPDRHRGRAFVAR